MGRKSISSIKSSLLRRLLLVMLFIPISIYAYLSYIAGGIIEVTIEIMETFKSAWKGN